MSQPDYENDLVFPPKEKMKKCNEKCQGECHCAFRCLSNEFCDAAEIRIKNLKEEMQQLKEFVNLYSHETVVIKQLRQLLKECKPLFFPYVKDMPLYAKRNSLQLILWQ